MRTTIPNNWAKAAERLRSEILRSLEKGSPVNFSVYSHAAITISLRSCTMDLSLRGMAANIVYRDLSRPEPFPLGTLADNCIAERLETLSPCIFGLLSHRHPEMDYLVDAYLTTNCEMSEAVSMADQDRMSMHNALTWFSYVDGSQPLIAYAVQSGLEPMIVGFYRGITKLLTPGSAQAGNLAIIPAIFRPDNALNNSTIRAPNNAPHSDSEVITPNTPGAALGDYIALAAWF